MGKLQRVTRVISTTAVLRRAGVEYGYHPRSEGWLPFIDRKDDSTIRLGDDAWFRGIEARATLRADSGGRLSIGDKALINSGASIQCSLSVTIGDDLLMAAFASIMDTDMHEVEPGGEVRRAPVAIGNRVWLGRNAVVLPGVTIGDWAVIGANAVVTRDVPARTVVGGVPARVLRSVS